MKQSFKIILYLIFYLLFLSDSSFAYFDPGTGAYFLQAIIAILSAVVFYLFHPILFLKRIFEKIKKKFFQKKEAK